MLRHLLSFGSASSRVFAAVVVASVVQTSVSPCLAERYVVSPRAYEDTEAPFEADVTGFPSYRLQQVYAAEDFTAVGPGPWTITGFDLRPDGSVAEPISYLTERWTLKLSTTPAVPGELSPVFAENIGADEMTVFDGPVSITTQGLGPDGGPKQFDYGFELDTPFTFDPSQGNLLAEHTIINGEGPARLDFDFNNTETTSFIWTGDLGVDSPVAATTPDESGGQWGGHVIRFTVASRLEAGDADQDQDFDQADVVRVQQSARYLTGQPATWGQGDWNGAPGGSPGNPPPGDGIFDQIDIITALEPAHYLTGPYFVLSGEGRTDDGQTSMLYNVNTGEIAVNAPVGNELTSINIDSAAGIFTGDAAANLGGSFDNDADNNIFKATFGSSFGSLSFGEVAQAGLEREFVLNDLTVIGSLDGGGDLGDVDLIYVPEPSSWSVLVLGLAGSMFIWRTSARLGTVDES